MSKIVIIAPKGSKDLKDAVKILESAGNEVTTEEPTAKTLLHMLLGLFGTEAFGFGSEYAIKAPGDEVEAPEPEETPDGEDKKDDKTEPEATEPESPETDVTEGDFNFEGITLDSEPVLVERFKGEKSVLVVTALSAGAKTSYHLNESKFSFWPTNPEVPAPRIQLVQGKNIASVDIELQLGESQKLLIGDDLIDLFK